MKKIQDIAAFLFITVVSILAFIAVLGVWDIFDKDVIIKSFQTLGLLAIVAIIVIVAGRFIDRRSEQGGAEIIYVSHPALKSIRYFTLTILIISVSLLALLGVFAIWEIISDRDVLYKSMGSIGIIAFCAFIIVLTALEREGKGFRNGKPLSIGSVILILFLGYLLFSLFGLFAGGFM